jgi:hypothetical protein
MDQEDMEARLIDESEGFDFAHNYYAEGAHSLSVATLTLAQPLSTLLLKGAEVTGEDEYNHDVTGILYQDASANSQILFFQYQAKEGDTKLCRVGALPVDDQIVNGCLVREGTINVASSGEIIAYNYDPYVDNNNGRTLQSFSLTAKKKFYECQNCPYQDFLKVSYALKGKRHLGCAERLSQNRSSANTMANRTMPMSGYQQRSKGDPLN